MKKPSRLEEIIMALVFVAGLLFAVIGLHYSLHEKVILGEARDHAWQEGYEAGFDDGYYDGYNDGYAKGSKDE